MMSESMRRHGHVIPNPDGFKARCGGVGLCKTCQDEKAYVDSMNRLRDVPIPPDEPPRMDAIPETELAELRAKAAMWDFVKTRLNYSISLLNGAMGTNLMHVRLDDWVPVDCKGAPLGTLTPAQVVQKAKMEKGHKP